MSTPCTTSYFQSRDVRLLLAFLCLSTLLIGLYHEALACLASLFLLWFLWKRVRKDGGLQLPGVLPLVTAVVISLLYGISALWAVDRGMALVGFAKFLCLPLFALVLFQISPEQRSMLLHAVPLLGAGSTLFSGSLALLPAASGYVLVNGRLAGTFQYPNTFALFLLIGVILLVTVPCRPRHWLPCLTVLLAGIAFAGSRTVFVLLALTLVLLLVLVKDRQVRYVLLVSSVLLLVMTLGYALLTGNVGTIARYLTISVDSSSLQGRLLYWQDALPVILKHPFGLGYLGYSTTLGSFQTGVYSLVHVHNEVLQLLLDIGWLPCALFLYTLFRGLCSNGKSLGCKLSITVLFLHSLMDFDLQYPIIWFVLLLCLLDGMSSGKVRTVRKGVAPLCALLTCICLYFCAVSGLYYTGHDDLCAKLCPAHTQANLHLLQRAQTAEEMECYADRILTHNPTSALALSAKARAAYARGNFEQMILYKEQVLAAARYSKEEYLDYFQMLSVGYQLYLQNGDIASAEVCRQKLLTIPDRMAEVLKETSPRAWRITDKPDLSLPIEYTAFLDTLR